MKYAHFIEMRVFSKEQDDEQAIISRIKELFPFDFEKEKISLGQKTALGFEDKKINIFTVNICKDRQIKKFLANLLSKIDQDQKSMLIRQLESRLDSNLHFYIRLDKDRLMEGEYFITDSGNCFHFTIAVAAFPHKREIAADIVRSIFS